MHAIGKAVREVYPSPVVPDWLSAQPSRPIGTHPPQIRKPCTPSGRPSEKRILAAQWALICSHLQYDYEARTGTNSHTPYGGPARPVSRLALFVYHQIVIMLGPDVSPCFDDILSNTPWSASFQRYPADEQALICKRQCGIDGIAEQVNAATVDMSVSVGAQANQDFAQIVREAKLGFRRDKPSPLAIGPPCIDLTGDQPGKSRPITGSRTTESPASKAMTPKSILKKKVKSAIDQELGSPVKTIADDYIKETMGLRVSDTDEESEARMDVDNGAQSQTIPMEVAGTPLRMTAAATRVPDFDVSQLETQQVVDSIISIMNVQLSPHVTGTPMGEEILEGDIGSHSPTREEEGRLIHAANTSSGRRSYDHQSRAPGNDRPSLGRE